MCRPYGCSASSCNSMSLNSKRHCTLTNIAALFQHIYPFSAYLPFAQEQVVDGEFIQWKQLLLLKTLRLNLTVTVFYNQNWKLKEAKCLNLRLLYMKGYKEQWQYRFSLGSWSEHVWNCQSSSLQADSAPVNYLTAIQPLQMALTSCW